VREVFDENYDKINVLLWFKKLNKNDQILNENRRDSEMASDYWVKVLCGGIALFLLVEALWYYSGVILSKVSRNRGFEKISLKQWGKDVVGNRIYKDVVEYSEIKLPERATAHSAGYDIFSPISFALNAGESIMIPTGFKSYMLQDEKLVFYPRSGLGFKYFIRLANTVGIGDSDYFNCEKNEGHYWVKVRNEGYENIKVEKGDAIAQCIFEKYLLADGDSFKGKKRIGGFGSTNK